MKRPVPLYEPCKESFINYKTDHIHSVNLYLTEDSPDEWEQNYRENNDLEDDDPVPEFIEFQYDNEICTLKDVWDKAPKNLTLEDIVIVISRDREVREVTVSFQSKKCINKEEGEKRYQKALKEYKDKLPQYEKDLKEYDDWLEKEELARTLKKHEEAAEKIRKQLENK